MSAGTLLGSLAATVFGGSCYVCRGAAGRGAIICAACERDLPGLPRERCPRCALPATGGPVCGRCLANPPEFDATVAALAYAFPVDVLVKALKFGSELALAPYLAGHLADELARMPERVSAVDLIIAVPLHPQRLAERGYNQSFEIARTLSRIAGTPLATGGCERLRDTPAQAELPLDSRTHNVRGAFACSLALAGCRVALVDDVMTTGATLDALAGAVKRAGALSVENWVVARTLWNMFDIVLYQPEIPPNTGNVIRLSANTGARLHLIEPLGFALEDRQLRRAGLDYHEFAAVHTHASLPDCARLLGERRWIAFSTRGGQRYSDFVYRAGDALLFGPETRGLPAEVLAGFPPERQARLPLTPGNRSLNLSNAVAVVVYEAWRQLGFPGGC